MSLRLSVDVEGVLRPVVRCLFQGVHGRESALAAPFIVDAFGLEELFDVEPILHWDLDSAICREKVDAGKDPVVVAVELLDDLLLVELNEVVGRALWDAGGEVGEVVPQRAVHPDHLERRGNEVQETEVFLHVAGRSGFGRNSEK